VVLPVKASNKTLENLIDALQFENKKRVFKITDLSVTGNFLLVPDIFLLLVSSFTD
jgi:hypothetical protein